jgi:hypothetical protein
MATESTKAIIEVTGPASCSDRFGVEIPPLVLVEERQ